MEVCHELSRDSPDYFFGQMPLLCHNSKNVKRIMLGMMTTILLFHSSIRIVLIFFNNIRLFD